MMKTDDEEEKETVTKGTKHWPCGRGDPHENRRNRRQGAKKGWEKEQHPGSCTAGPEAGPTRRERPWWRADLVGPTKRETPASAPTCTAMQLKKNQVVYIELEEVTKGVRSDEGTPGKAARKVAAGLSTA